MEPVSSYDNEHILVCLSSSPSNPRIVRAAARMADAFGGRLTALYVDDGRTSFEEDRKRLKENIELAERLGASVETVYGDDIALQIAEYARLSGASKVVLGRSRTKKSYFFKKPSFSERLAQMAPGLDIYIIPDYHTETYNRKPVGLPEEKLTGIDVLKSIGILIGATLIGILFQKVGFSDPNIIMIYMLGVLLTALVTNGRMYSLTVSVISVLLFNFFFTEPFLTFHATGAEYPVTFLVMLLTAFVISSLTTQMKRQAVNSTGLAYRTQILLETDQLLQQQKNEEELISVTANQLKKLLKRDVVYYKGTENELEEPVWYPYHEKSEYQDERFRSKSEREAANWAYENNKHCGSGTRTMSGCVYQYLVVRGSVKFGVLGINMNGESLTSFENSLVLSIIGECALAMEKDLFARKREEAATQAKNEQLRSNLLRSISHDLRTPLTGISGNASMLLEVSDRLDEEKKHRLYNDIYEDSQWLINLVENLLSITRIENGTVNINRQMEVMEDVVHEAVQHSSKRKKNHTITIEPQEDILLAKIDAGLIRQVLVNLIDNAIKYTQEDSEIRISMEKQDNEIVVSVADNGPGIPDDRKEKVFEMFYTENHAPADSRRGMGLGLALCRSIINAHGGTITVADNVPRGTIFRFTLPSEEAMVYE